MGIGRTRIETEIRRVRKTKDSNRKGRATTSSERQHCPRDRCSRWHDAALFLPAETGIVLRSPGTPHCRALRALSTRCGGSPLTLITLILRRRPPSSPGNEQTARARKGSAGEEEKGRWLLDVITRRPRRPCYRKRRRGRRSNDRKKKERKSDRRRAPFASTLLSQEPRGRDGRSRRRSRRRRWRRRRRRRRRARERTEQLLPRRLPCCISGVGNRSTLSYLARRTG